MHMLCIVKTNMETCYIITRPKLIPNKRDLPSCRESIYQLFLSSWQFECEEEKVQRRDKHKALQLGLPVQCFDVLGKDRLKSDYIHHLT